jgi:alkylhydroperoxidase family enzyme
MPGLLWPWLWPMMWMQTFWLASRPTSICSAPCEMTAEPRYRLRSGEWVSALILSEIRLAQKDGRAIDVKAMQAAALWAKTALGCEVIQYNLRRQIRRAYR